MLLFDDELEVEVGCDVLVLEDATVVEVMTMLEDAAVVEVPEVVAIFDDVGKTDVAPMNAFSTEIMDLDSLRTYYLTGLRLC